MDKLFLDFENLKYSAFEKYSKLTGNIHNVTIGPNTRIHQERLEEPASPKKVRIKTSTRTERVSNKSPSIPISHVLKEYEAGRREELQDILKLRYNMFENFERMQKVKNEHELSLKRQVLIQNREKVEQKILQVANQQDSNRIKENEKLVTQYQDLIQRKLLLEQQLEKTKAKQKILFDNIEKIKRAQLEFSSIYEEIIGVIKMLASSEETRKAFSDNFKLLRTLGSSFEAIIVKCKSGDISEEQVTKTLNLLIQIKQLKIQIDNTVAKIKEKKEAKVPPKQPLTAAKATEPVKTVEFKSTVTNINQCVSVANLKKYGEMKQFLAQYSELFKGLLNSEPLKQFRFDCKKAINIPVNAISGVNAEHLRDKYVKLNNLLSGKVVIVADRQINASRCPEGIPFCMDLLAKKFVLQGDLLISSNPEAAFSYATVIISLWNDFPEFGKLLLAYFYTQCPYLVPFYIAKTEEQTYEEYYTSIGYHYVDGQIEQQGKFLKRMTGVLRLYFAITIAKPKRGQQKNPHDIKHAWQFLASILKLDPLLDITATVLHIFLETVGFEMEAVYGIAFKKLTLFIIENFMPKLRSIDSGGPVTRLEVLLQDYKQKGHFEKPSGVLTNNFW